jgi:hypothetical protein
MGSTLLSYIFIVLPQVILAIIYLAILDFTSIYALLCLAQYLFAPIRTRLEDQAMTITAALLLSFPYVAIQLGLTALQSLGETPRNSWQRRAFR